MKRFVLVLLLMGLPITVWADDSVPALLKQAQALKTAGKLDEAIQLYEKVLVEHPEAANRWYEAESNIAQALAKKGDLAGAAKAAHLCLDGAPNLQAFDQTVMLTARILSAQDKSVDRANQFIAFEQSGSTGGQTNPMDAVGYPSQPERETAFAAMRKQAGDDAAASRLRALTFLFTGKPRDALAQFADAFRRNANLNDPASGGGDLVLIGLRAAQGHRAGLDQAMQFVIFGPNGPDGKTKIANPFAALLPAAPPVGEGGVAGLDAVSLAALRQVRDAAQAYAGDTTLSGDVRKPALAALNRANTALDGWGAPGQEDWYFQRALGLDSATDERASTIFISGAELSARGRDVHYGGVHALWNEIDAAYAAKSATPPKQVETIRKQFDKTCATLGNTPFPKQDLKPLKTPATF